MKERILHPYMGRVASLATQHGKEKMIARPLRAAVGLKVVVPGGIDTDTLGTFSGEVERVGTMVDVAARKARLGMRALDVPLGLASEGSFGPHPHIPLVPMNLELLFFLDQVLEIQIVEQTVTHRTNYGHTSADSLESATAFLTRARFPSHALIVRPNSGYLPGLLFKGITTVESLKEAVEQCAASSADGMAHLETDMRAHMNPSRRAVIRSLAFRLARRVATCCAHCGAPGWGLLDYERGLLCEYCRWATDLVSREIWGCSRCEHREERPRKDGLELAPAMHCPLCNP